MVAMSTLMNLKYFARRGLWQYFIWMKRSGALMFNRCLALRYGDYKLQTVSRLKSPSLASRSLKDFKNEKILCRVCFEEQINIVLLPCRHHVLCRCSYLSIPINTAKVLMINALIYLLNLMLRHHNFSCMYVYCNYLQNCNLCLMIMDNITFIIKGCGIMHNLHLSTCCKKCKRCPICHVSNEERLSVYDV
ncbi:hypothetical protein ES288_A13G166100v1 [Gossypium darwinii]|uniref:RING-type domain-containing protein n=1 Tax=Gossypium darwinii TaxID=34276 RepID=A0A5D2E0M4_GOSDA|nr:hypothetical protein ES288_A13G166100v1 [Gossypium darwinii]